MADLRSEARLWGQELFNEIRNSIIKFGFKSKASYFDYYAECNDARTQPAQPDVWIEAASLAFQELAEFHSRASPHREVKQLLNEAIPISVIHDNKFHGRGTTSSKLSFLQTVLLQATMKDISETLGACATIVSKEVFLEKAIQGPTRRRKRCVAMRTAVSPSLSSKVYGVPKEVGALSCQIGGTIQVSPMQPYLKVALLDNHHHDSDSEDEEGITNAICDFLLHQEPIIVPSQQVKYGYTGSKKNYIIVNVFLNQKDSSYIT